VLHSGGGISPCCWVYLIEDFLAFEYPDILLAHVFFSPYAMFFWQKISWNDTITSSSSVVQISSLLCTRRHMFGGMNPAYPRYPYRERKSMPYGCAHYLLERLNTSEIGTAATLLTRQKNITFPSCFVCYLFINDIFLL